MSAEVMYPSYMHSPYFGTSYQRAVSTSTDPFKKFGSATLKMHDGLFDGGTYASSFSTPSVTSTAPAAAGSAATAAAAGTTGIKAEEDPLDKDNLPQSTQYLSPSCMLLTYFSGDIATNVDDHFSRSLSDNQGSSKGGSPSWKDSSTTPMTSRNFPPSFWNSNYQPAVHTDFSSLHASTDPYMTASGLHGMSTALAAQDPWRYPLSTQTAAHTYSAHHSMHDALAYSSMAAASGSRFQSHYGSLLPTTSRLASQCDLAKHSTADSWSSRYHPSSDLSHAALAASTAHHDTTSHLHTAATLTGGGIDSTMVVDMNGSKDVRSDPYWF